MRRMFPLMSSLQGGGRVAERNQAVSTAVQWINQSITEELWGLVPSNQAEVDHRLRYSFHFKIIMAGYKCLIVFMFLSQ